MIRKHPSTKAERLELEKKYSLKKTRGKKPLEDSEYVGAIPEEVTEAKSLGRGPDSPPWFD